MFNKLLRCLLVFPINSFIVLIQVKVVSLYDTRFVLTMFFLSLYVHGSVIQQKSNGSGIVNQMHKQPSSRHQKPGARRTSNGAPPYPVPMPYHQPPVPPFFHAMVPPPHIAVPGYAFPPGPGPFPSVENPAVKPASQAPRQAFVPPGHAVDAKTGQPPVQGDPNSYINFSNGRPNMQEQGDHLNHAWHHQRPFPSRANISMQQGLGPRPFVRPPFYGPPPGYMIGPSFPGKISIHGPLFMCIFVQLYTHTSTCMLPMSRHLCFSQLECFGNFLSSSFLFLNFLINNSCNSIFIF